MMHKDQYRYLQNGLFKITLLALWTIGHYPTLLWLAQKSIKHLDALFIAIFLIGAFGYFLFKAKISSDLYVTRSALILILIAVCGSILNVLTINFYQVNLMLWMVGIYGLLGLNRDLWPKWLRALNIFILIAFAVPFYLEFSSGLGFGLRLLTASVVEQTLETVGVNAISSQDIIITENAISHVDIPCSGLKSIWVGTALFLVALIILNIKIGLNTVWKYGLFILLLFSGNIFRVLILTALTSVYHLPKIAKLLHVPIGILGFGISCCVAWFLLDSCSKATSLQNNLMPKLFSEQTAKYCLCLILFLICGQIAATILNVPVATTDKISHLTLPNILNLQSVPLTEGEKKYFSRAEQTIARKWKFSFEKNEGSILLVKSLDFNMFHAPELCMVANGVVIDRMETVTITPERQARVMALNGGQATGIYWLQSGSYMTESFGKRYWRYLWSNEKKWHMVSIIVNKPLAFKPDIIEDIIKPIYSYLSSKGKNETTILQ